MRTRKGAPFGVAEAVEVMIAVSLTAAGKGGGADACPFAGSVPAPLGDLMSSSNPINR